jgi:hypothetical protein
LNDTSAAAFSDHSDSSSSSSSSISSGRVVCAFLAHAHKEAIVGEARAQHQWKRRVCVASPSGGSSAATSAAVLAVDLFVGWVFLNITPHIAMRIKPWTVWGF